MISDLSLFHAIPEPRGCGEREPGGCYVESGIGPSGLPLEHFLLDPPQPLPPGLDLVNKPQIFPRLDASGEQARDAADQPIFDLYMHIGAEHYPCAPDYIEETRRLGASRRISPLLDVSLLTRASCMILAHPKAIPANWAQLQPPARCRKRLERHDLLSYRCLARDPLADDARPGPCLFKVWELIPLDQAESTIVREGQLSLCLRRNGSTVYSYSPTEESVTAWEEAFILALPLTGFTLIQYADGSVNTQAKQKLQAASEQNGMGQLPVYEAPR